MAAYDPRRRTVLLTRQHRYPAYIDAHPGGMMLIEVAAGLLDDEAPETATRREAREKRGVIVGELRSYELRGVGVVEGSGTITMTWPIVSERDSGVGSVEIETVSCDVSTGL